MTNDTYSLQELKPGINRVLAYKGIDYDAYAKTKPNNIADMISLSESVKFDFL